MTLPQMIADWGHQPGGWTKISLVIGVPLMILGLGRFFFVKETVTNAKVEQGLINIPLKESLVILGKNKYVFILAGCILSANIIQAVTGGVQTYYFQYILGDLRLMSLIGMVSLFTPFVLLLFPVAMRKIGSMGFIRIGLIVGIVGSAIKILFGRNSALLIAGHFLSSVGVGPLTMMINLFLIECMEYSEWKTSKRVDGYVPALVNFAGKLGTGIAAGGVGIIMSYAGYNGALETQSESALASIFSLFTWVPGIMCILMFILVSLYDLGKKMPQIKQDIAERQAARNSDGSQARTINNQ
jgi:GPH family glycoside/pentoside/hexuronide:cation symporter